MEPALRCGRVARQQRGQLAHHLIDGTVNTRFFVCPWGVQHKICHVLVELKCARMANADAHPPKSRRAQMRLNVAHPVVPAVASPLLYAHRSGGNVQFVMNDHNVVGL